MAKYLMVWNPKNIRPVNKSYEVFFKDIYVQNVNFETNQANDAVPKKTFCSKFEAQLIFVFFFIGSLIKLGWTQN